MSELRHTTVTITENTLIGRGACFKARTNLASLLPAKLSTNPERNFALARKVLDKRATLADKSDMRRWLDWMFNDVSDTYGDLPCPDWDYYSNDEDEYERQFKYDEDLGVIAQWLAAIADKFAAKKGR